MSRSIALTHFGAADTIQAVELRRNDGREGSPVMIESKAVRLKDLLLGVAILLASASCSSAGKCPQCGDCGPEGSCPDLQAPSATPDTPLELSDGRTEPDLPGNCYAINPTYFRFEPVQSLTSEQIGLPSAMDVSTVAMSPDGRNLYANSWVKEFSGGAVTVFGVDSMTGKLSPVQTVLSWEDTTDEPFDDPDTAWPSVLQISNDGKSAYAVGWGQAALVLCDRNVDSGILKYSTMVPRSEVQWPDSVAARTFVESPDSSYVHVGTDLPLLKGNARITTLRAVDGDPPVEFVSNIEEFNGQGFTFILAMAYDPGGQYMVAFVDCGRLVVFGIDPETNEFMPLTELPYTADCSGKYTVGLHFAPEGKKFILASSTAPAQVFELVVNPYYAPFDEYPNVKPLHLYTEHALSLSICGGAVWGSALSPDGLSLVLRMQYCPSLAGPYVATTAAAYWSPETAGLEFESVWTGHEDCGTPSGPELTWDGSDSAVFSPDGRFVYIGQTDCYDPPGDEISAPLLEVYERVPLL